ncbi:MAG: hypothetical protein H8M99_13610 [Gloeobacteraceae cyanobacterium ES-bin-144]|nr:hypothetical protein [Verrucomicrobiales bacterium]
METPSASYILSRAAFLVVVLMIVLFAISFIKKKQRQSAIIAELQSITSDSSFFKQFYAEEAQKSLIRAIGLIAESNSLDVDPNTTINLGMGIKTDYFSNDFANKEPMPRERIIRTCLRSNYENFLKLGYKADFQTLTAMKAGDFPPIPTGPQSGKKPEIYYLISPAISPGMDKVIANLEIRPPSADKQGKSTDIEIAAAKELARELANASIIEDAVRDRIIAGLTTPNP